MTLQRDKRKAVECRKLADLVVTPELREEADAIAAAASQLERKAARLLQARLSA